VGRQLIGDDANAVFALHVITLVNHHHLSEPIPQSAYSALTTRFAEMWELGLRTLQIIEVADGHVILALSLTLPTQRRQSANRSAAPGRANT
jgi:hypothetical protein